MIPVGHNKPYKPGLEELYFRAEEALLERNWLTGKERKCGVRQLLTTEIEFDGNGEPVAAVAGPCHNASERQRSWQWLVAFNEMPLLS